MNVLRDLFITANAKGMAVTVAAIEQTLPPGWTRDRDAEIRSQALSVSDKRISYCFARKKENRLPAAKLILAQMDPDTFYIANIIPVERHQLEHAEYNGVFEDFFEHVFKPYAEKAHLTYTITGPEADLEQWMDEHTAELLRGFSHSANKGTGASHPNDRARWNAFLLSAHLTRSKLDPSTLERWLVEAEGWSPEVAEQLALEYESGLGLLEYANIQR